MAVRERVFRQLAERRLKKMKFSWINMRMVQEAQLDRLLKAGRKTIWGREHGFDSINTYEEYKSRIPITRYEDMKKWWKRLYDGERNVTWPGRIKYMAMTSGTTQGNKYLPISRHNIRTTLKGGFDASVAYYARTGDSSISGGKTLFLGGSTDLEREGKVFVGDNSGIQSDGVPRFLQRMRIPDRKTGLIRDWERKVEVIAEQALEEDIRVIGGVPSWTTIFCRRALEIAASKDRKADCLRGIWPNLKCYVHGGMSYSPYRDRLAALLGDGVVTVDTYSATEGGFLAVQQEEGNPAMALLLDRGVFYEFVPLEELDNENPKRFPIWEVEPGVVYVVLLTANSGVWSYFVGDTLKFDSVTPPNMLFTGRTKSFLNAFGEHVIEEELETAVREACEGFGVSVSDYTVAPFFPDEDNPVPGHRWFVEFTGGAPDSASFFRRVDESIRANNEDYDTHRKGDYALWIDLTVCPEGTFYKWMKRRGKLGGQNKVPRVLTDPELVKFLEEAIVSP